MFVSRLADAAKVATVAGTLAIATVGAYEGLRLAAYRDVIGVWTVCYGETKGVRQGMRFTEGQCKLLFLDSLIEHEKGMRSCLNDPDSLSDKTYVAFLSLTYNIGVGAWCKSSVVRAANNLQLTAACRNILRFNKAGGRVIGGLVKRRSQEMKLCMEGLR